MKTVFRVARYAVSKDSSPTEFPVMRMRKPLCKYRLKSFPQFSSPAWVSRLRPVHKVVGGTNPGRDWRARPGRKVRKFLVSLDISETLCPSRVRPARQVLFHVFLPERRTSAGKSIISGKCGKLHNPYSTR
jgi:hypothetical protein